MRWLLLAQLAIILAACQPSPAPSEPRALNPPSDNKLGVHMLLDDGRKYWPEEIWPEHLSAARDAVGEWGYVTQVVRLDDLDTARWQVFMDACADLHLTPILRLATTFAKRDGFWAAPPVDLFGGYRGVAGRYAGFITSLRWPTGDHLIIVHNEPNHGNEWGGKPNPAEYAQFLVDVSDAIHATDPNARVMNAGFDSYSPHSNGLPMPDGFAYIDEESFLDGMVAAQPDVFRRIDAWVSHSYPPGPFTRPPWEQSYGADLINGAANPDHRDPPEGVFNRGVNGYGWELWKLSTYGIEDLPVFITETGWRHSETAAESTDNAPLPLPDAATVALYLDLALRGNNGRYPDWPEDGWTPWLDDPRIVAITPFAFDGNPVEWGHTNWLILDAEGGILGAYPMVTTWYQP